MPDATRWRRRAAVAWLLGAVVSAVGATPAAGVSPDAEFGVNVQTLLRGGPGGVFPSDQWDLYLGRAAQLGIRAGRVEAVWNWAEEAPPEGGGHTYDWRRQDAVVEALARNGLRWLPVLSFIPSWALTNGANRFPEAYHDDFAAFAAAVAQRYGPGGAFWAERPGLTPMPVESYEVWSEPNSTNAWDGRPNPPSYWSVYRQIRSALHAVDPAAEVLLSLGWMDYGGYLRQLHAAAGPSWAADGIAFHPYAPTPLGILSLVRDLRQVMDELGLASKPIQIWELGWPRAAQLPPAARSWEGLPSDEARAANLSVATDALMRSDCNVTNVTAYSLAEREQEPQRPNEPDTWEQWFGLLRPGAEPTATMRAWSASIARTRADRAAAPGPSTLPVCGPATAVAPAQALLPLELAVTLTSRGCVLGRVGYHGYPLEEAGVLYAVGGDEGGQNTNTSGEAAVCVPQRFAGERFVVRAALGRVAASGRYECDANGCRVEAAAATRRCRAPHFDVARRARVRGGRLRLRVAIRCDQRRLRSLPVRIHARRAKGLRLLRTLRATYRYRRVTLRVPPGTRSLLFAYRGSPRLELKPTRARVTLVASRRRG